MVFGGRDCISLSYAPNLCMPRIQIMIEVDPSDMMVGGPLSQHFPEDNNVHL